MRVLVTGAAGFIGMHLALRLRRDGAEVLAVDNFDPYYDVALKRERAARLAEAGVRCETLDLADATTACAYFRRANAARVVHLAAQPGVRYSLVNPAAYLRNNVDAFGAVLEGCRESKVEHLVYASSSSVYGANHTLPFSEDQNVDQPVSLYAATKRANELMAYSYSHLYRMPVTGLRFFTVYGPWGRPDMSPMIFARAMLDGEPIKVFNHGRMRRDFTFIDDIVEGISRVLARPPTASPAGSAPSAIYNIGNHTAVELETFIDELESLLGVRAVRQYEPLQPGDVTATVASIERLQAATGFSPSTPLREGLAKFVQWYLAYRSGNGTAA
jgi:UDP-glucuronate 4-epimerase